MPRKQDNDTRVHFRIFEDETHAQKRAFCLNCNKDACADNIQRMKNHLLKCEAYINNGARQPAEPVFALQMDGAGGIAPDASMQAMGQQQQQQQQHMAPGAGGPIPDGGSVVPGPPPPPPPPQQQQQQQQQQDPNGMPLPPTPNPGGLMAGQSTPRQAAPSKATQNGLDKVRQAMGRSTRRMESLEAVLKTQIQDGMHNAATHVRAAIRDERERLFKLSQTLVKQETKLRESQNLGTF